MTPQQEIIEKVKVIFDKHKTKLDNIKENRSKWGEEKWTDAEVSSTDEQIRLLAEILSDLNIEILSTRNKQWWKGKTLDQLPKYVKDTKGNIYEVVWEINDGEYFVKQNSVKFHYFFPISIGITPATEEQYQQYLIQKVLET